MAAEQPERDIQELIEGQISLPSPSGVALQILNLVRDPDSSFTDLEKIITADPALTTKMLRIANSSFYSPNSSVNSVGRALSLLGTNVIKNIALSFVIAEDLMGSDQSLFDFNKFWRRAITAAVAAELIMNELPDNNDAIFIAALLKDIGIMVLYQSKGEEYLRLLTDNTLNNEEELLHAEKDFLNYTHQDVGFHFLENWGLPSSIASPILFHHQPEKAGQEHDLAAKVLNVAGLMSVIYNTPGSSSKIRDLQSRMEEYFDIQPDRTREIVDDLALKSIDVFAAFEIEAGQVKTYTQLIQEANEELGKLNLSYEQVILELKEAKEQSEWIAGQLREANEKLETLAFKDSLTNVYNHRYLQEVLEIEMSRARRYGHNLCLVIFDIDHFKRVNDTFGHPAGDVVLMELANTITAAIRPSDIIARYGGEEFILILPETHETGMKVFAERIRRAVESMTVSRNDTKIKVTISLGGVHLPTEMAISKDELIEIADKALYISKSNGRNRTTILSASQA